MALRVVVVDDHAVVRDGLRALLATRGIDVVADADDGESGVRETQIALPDVVLMDIAMPGIDGVEATRRIRRVAPGTRVLVLTMFDDDETVLLAMRAGASGYVLKGATQDELVAAISAVATGQLVFGPGIAARVLGLFHPGNVAAATPPPFPQLTERERTILELLAAGHRTGAIAATLHLSPKTVSNNLTGIFSKLEVSDRTEAMLRAREHGMGP